MTEDFKPQKTANFSNSNLRDAKMAGARLPGSDFSFSDASHANFTGGDFRKSNFEGATLIGSHLTGAKFSDSNLRSADLNIAHITGVDFSGAFMEDADLTGASLVSVDFSHAILEGADFRGAHIVGCNFNDAEVGGAKFLRSSLDMIEFSPHQMKLIFVDDDLVIDGLDPETDASIILYYEGRVGGGELTTLASLIEALREMEPGTVLSLERIEVSDEGTRIEISVKNISSHSIEDLQIKAEQLQVAQKN
jgi:hypothetical protein